jgi:hypothetical protein
MYPTIVAGQRLGKKVTAATNTHRIEEFLETGRFYEVRVVSKESKRLVLPRTSYNIMLSSVTLSLAYSSSSLRMILPSLT